MGTPIWDAHFSGQTPFKYSSAKSVNSKVKKSLLHDLCEDKGALPKKMGAVRSRVKKYSNNNKISIQSDWNCFKIFIQNMMSDLIGYPNIYSIQLLLTRNSSINLTFSGDSIRVFQSGSNGGSFQSGSTTLPVLTYQGRILINPRIFYLIPQNHRQPQQKPQVRYQWIRPTESRCQVLKVIE